jgi:pimeloyl-ACP methyl ester carboxylesterase
MVWSSAKRLTRTMRETRQRAALLIWLLLAGGCAIPYIEPAGLADIDRSALPKPNVTIDIPGLGPCADIDDRRVAINQQQPVTIIVHGCYGSAGRLRSLSQVFAFHGQQSLCFSYDDRDSLEQSSAELIKALHALQAIMAPDADIRVLAHSQGGLVARRALIQDRPDQLQLAQAPAELITISTPFAGIPAASTCGSIPVHVLSLGSTVAICRYISGRKWWEITASSDFIQKPGSPLPDIQRHLKIITDERDSCRIRNDAGRCVSRDGVFGITEQYHPPVDNYPIVANIEVRAGHVEIVGDAEAPPTKLIGILQDEGVMRPTEPAREKALQALLAELY